MRESNVATSGDTYAYGSPTEDELIAFALSLNKRDRRQVTQVVKACQAVGLGYISTRMVLTALYQRRQSTI